MVEESQVPQQEVQSHHFPAGASAMEEENLDLQPLDAMERFESAESELGTVGKERIAETARKQEKYKGIEQ